MLRFLYRLVSPLFAFGTSPVRPIIAFQPNGEMTYLARLRCPCDRPLLFHRIGSTSHFSQANQLDIFETACLYGKHRSRFYFNMYPRQTSDRAPSGYRLLEDGEFNEVQTYYGTNGRVTDFPYGLPDAIKGRGDNPQGILSDYLATVITHNFKRP